MTRHFIPKKYRFLPLVLLLFLTTGPNLSTFAATVYGGGLPEMVREVSDTKIPADYAAALRLMKQEKYREALPHL